MKPYAIFTISLFFLFLTAAASMSFEYELKTHYATIMYEQEEQLSKFNDKISLISPSDLKKDLRIITAGDEVRYKLDVIVEKIEIILHICPRGLKFNIMLLSTPTEVQKYYHIKYGISSDYIAFYSPQDKTIFISVKDVDNYVLAHEITHVIVDQYFVNCPSAIIHEILAHFVQTHIDF